MKTLAITLLIYLTLAVPSYAQSTITVATYQYADNNRLDNIKPLAAHISKSCGCETNTKSYASVNDMLISMKNGESDVVLMNTFGYLLLPKEQKNYKATAALQIAPGKQSTYQSAFVIRKDLNIHSLDALAQEASSLNLLLVNPGSTSGNLVPRLALASVGIEDANKAFKSVTYSKNHALTLEAVAKGEYDAGAFGSEEYTKALAKDASIKDKVNLIWTSSDIPLGPVMVKTSLDKKLKQCISQTLLRMDTDNPKALESVKAGWTEAIPADKYIPVSGKHYQQWLQSMGGQKALPIIQQFAN